MILCDGHGEPFALPDPLDPATGAAYYPHAAKLQDLADRLRQRGGDDAIPKLLAALIGLLPGYLARFGPTPPADAGMQGRYITRLADALSHRWLAAAVDAILGLPPLDEVLRSIQEGRLVDGDILAEVCLAEGVCQGDNGAREYFHRHYAGVIADEARRIGGRAAQELEGLPQDLICNTRRLAGFRGLSNLAVWLRCVVRSSWKDLHKAEGRERCRSEALGPSAGGTLPAADDPPGDGECGEERLAALARRVVGVPPADGALWLRMIYLDGVRQVAIARAWRVDKAKVSRHACKARRKVLEAFQECTGVMAGPQGSATAEAVAEAVGVTKSQLMEAVAQALRERTSR